MECIFLRGIKIELSLSEIIYISISFYTCKKIVYRRVYKYYRCSPKWQLRLSSVNHSQMPIISALQLMSTRVTALALLHYDYNTIRDCSSIRANHYNYNARGKGCYTRSPCVKSARGNQLYEKLQHTGFALQIYSRSRKALPVA